MLRGGTYLGTFVTEGLIYDDFDVVLIIRFLDKFLGLNSLLDIRGQMCNKQDRRKKPERTLGRFPVTAAEARCFFMAKKWSRAVFNVPM